MQTLSVVFHPPTHPKGFITCLAQWLLRKPHWQYSHVSIVSYEDGDVANSVLHQMLWGGWDSSPLSIFREIHGVLVIPVPMVTLYPVGCTVWHYRHNNCTQAACRVLGISVVFWPSDLLRVLTEYD